MGRPGVPEAEVFAFGDTVEEKDCPIVDAESKLSFCANCAPLACVMFVVLRLVVAAEVAVVGFSVIPCVVCDVALGEEGVGLLVLVSCVVLAAVVVSTGAGTVVVVVCEVAVVSGSTAFDVTAEVVVLTVVV